MLHIFIVSLVSDIERRANIEKLLLNSGLSFEFVDAIYGKDLTEIQLSSLNLQSAQQRLNRKLSPGEIGCTLSHLKAYGKLVSNNYEWACILEDDAILDSRFIDFIRESTSTSILKPSNIYMLGGQDGLPASDFIARSFFSKINLSNQVFFKTIDSYEYIFRTCCYLISSAMATRFLNLSENIFFVADDWLFFHEIGVVENIYISDFVQHPKDLSGSHIETERLVLFNDANSKKSLSLTFRLMRKSNFLLKKAICFFKRIRF